MQQPLTGGSTLYLGASGQPSGGYYPSSTLQYLGAPGGGMYAPPPAYQALHEGQEEASMQVCMRDSVRLLGEAVAVVEGVRLLGAQLLQWGLELSGVFQSLLPAALFVQLGRWIYTRTIGASRRRTLTRMSRAWQEASSSGAGQPGARLLLPPTTSSSSTRATAARSSSLGFVLSALLNFSAVLALFVVAAELYLHFHVYRRLVARLRVLTAKGPRLFKSADSSSSSKERSYRKGCNMNPFVSSGVCAAAARFEDAAIPTAAAAAASAAPVAAARSHELQQQQL
ncbi:hypothetical protein Efla_004129 [Eimeria flavescens]